MAILITAKQLAANKDFAIPINSIANSRASLSEKIQSSLFGGTAYRIHQTEGSPSIHINCKPASRGLPLFKIAGEMLVLDKSNISQGTNYLILPTSKAQQTPHQAPIPEWDDNASPAIKNIPCTLLQNHLNEIYLVLQKYQKNKNKRTWMFGRTTAGTFAAINESNRFIRFTCMHDLMNFGEFIKRHYNEAPVHLNSPTHVDDRECIVDCNLNYPNATKICGRHLFDNTTSDPALREIPRLSGPSKAYTVSQLPNGYYAASKGKTNVTWFVDKSFANVIGNLKSEVIYYLKTKDKQAIWDSETHPDLFNRESPDCMI